MPSRGPGETLGGFYATTLVVLLLILAALTLAGAREWALADWYIVTKSVANRPNS
jgi:hypothetical protein